MVDGWLRQVFLGAEIEDTSKEDGKMDRQMVWNNVKILIDAKNHEGKLHSIHDVKKFHDNVHANPDAQIAILLCLHTKVPNHNKFWVETEIINENQLVVYMNNVSMNPIERLQLVAGTVIQPWKEYLDLRRKMRELLVGDELKTWADTAKSVLTKGWAHMMRLQDQWTKTHSAVQASMKEFQDMLVQLTQELQTDLRSIEIEAEMALSTAKKGRSKK